MTDSPQFREWLPVPPIPALNTEPLPDIGKYELQKPKVTDCGDGTFDVTWRFVWKDQP